MDGERGQTHTGDTLEHGALRHDHAVILSERDFRRGPERRVLGFGVSNGHIASGHALDDLVLRRLAGVFIGIPGGREGPPVSQVGLVAFVADIADEVGP